MRSKIISASGSLVLGISLFFLALKSDPTASADTLALDPNSLMRFKIILVAATILVLVSFVLFVMAAMHTDKR